MVKKLCNVDGQTVTPVTNKIERNEVNEVHQIIHTSSSSNPNTNPNPNNGASLQNQNQIPNNSNTASNHVSNSNDNSMILEYQSRYNEYQSNRNSTNKCYHCYVCGKQLESELGLDRHQRANTLRHYVGIVGNGPCQVYPSQCRYCMVCFGSEEHLHMHQTVGYCPAVGSMKDKVNPTQLSTSVPLPTHLLSTHTVHVPTISTGSPVGGSYNPRVRQTSTQGQGQGVKRPLEYDGSGNNSGIGSGSEYKRAKQNETDGTLGVGMGVGVGIDSSRNGNTNTSVNANTNPNSARTPHNAPHIVIPQGKCMCVCVCVYSCMRVCIYPEYMWFHLFDAFYQ